MMFYALGRDFTMEAIYEKYRSMVVYSTTRRRANQDCGVHDGRYQLNVSLPVSFAPQHLRSRGYDIDGENDEERLPILAGNLRHFLLSNWLKAPRPSDAGRWNLVRFNPDNVLPVCITRHMTGRDGNGRAWAQVSLYCAKLKKLYLSDGAVSTAECGRLAADITRQFDLSRAGRPVSGFFCSECARRAPAREDPEGARLLYVWWAGKPAQEGPMQLRLTGIGTNAARLLGPSDARPQEEDTDTRAQAINMGIRHAMGKSRFRFRMNKNRSLEVWNRLCSACRS